MPLTKRWRVKGIALLVVSATAFRLCCSSTSISDSDCTFGECEGLHTQEHTAFMLQTGLEMPVDATSSGNGELSSNTISGTRQTHKLISPLDQTPDLKEQATPSSNSTPPSTAHLPNALSTSSSLLREGNAMELEQKREAVAESWRRVMALKTGEQHVTVNRVGPSSEDGLFIVMVLTVLVLIVLVVLAAFFSCNMVGVGLSDGVSFLAAVALPALIAYGFFGNVKGGNMPADKPFPWHPVLMALAFPCLMILGRLAYTVRLGLDNMAQRQIHRTLMVLALLCMVGGYYCIFKAHLPVSKFFGYDFVKGEWGPPSRVAHSLLGYAIIACVLLQAVIGSLKMASETKIHTWHGYLGKVILILGLAEILLATWFWGWEKKMKYAIVILVAVLGAASVAPRPSASEGANAGEKPLAASA